MPWNGEAGCTASVFTRGFSYLPPRDADEAAGGAHTGDKMGDLLPALLPNLFSGRREMRIRIDGVVILVRIK